MRDVPAVSPPAVFASVFFAISSPLATETVVTEVCVFVARTSSYVAMNASSLTVIDVLAVLPPAIFASVFFSISSPLAMETVETEVCVFVA